MKICLTPLSIDSGKRGVDKDARGIVGAATGIEVREVFTGEDQTIKTLGIMGGGCETMRYAWPKLRVLFSVRHEGDTLPKNMEDPPTVRYGPHRNWPGLLDKHPVDMLVVERGHCDTPSKGSDQSPWEQMVFLAKKKNQPKVVIEMWQARATVWKHGPTSKAITTKWRKAGYATHCRQLNAMHIGGAINQSRFVVVRVKQQCQLHWHWDQLDRDLTVIRPMSNLLIPPGLVPKKAYRRDQHYELPDAQKDPMPQRVGAMIRTEKGVRRLTEEEVARGLGVPKGSESGIKSKSLDRTTSLFHWEYLSYSIQQLKAPMVKIPVKIRQAEFVRSDLPEEQTEGFGEEENINDFNWTPPDLTPGGQWHSVRIKNLRQAASGYRNSEEIYQDGLKTLDIHRGNYNEEGPSPKWLQLLWWEFPAEHWEELRVGSRQNFLVTPKAKIQPNAPMDAEMTQAAIEFLEELMELGVMRTIDEGLEILANAPLFAVPKPGQPGQWRIIADMLRGGQNECVGQDPVFMPRVSQIAGRMYEGGYSAVVDLSKFFHNFPTHREDRPYLGLLHPGTQELLAYFGLAMGAGNSPAIACRLGLAFVRLVKEKFKEFQGKGRANCYWTGLRSNGFDPELGYGFVLEGRDGGAVLIWVFVDDFLLHGPTFEKTSQALKFFLDTAVDCGFLFHPKKLITPRQVVKYCGFLFDTRGVPCLRIPEAKKERALAICEYLLEAPRTKEWSRLSLAVAVGVLESLSEATPRRLGHTHLRDFHSLVHPPGLGTGAEPYYTTTTLNEAVIEELEWWIGFLRRGKGRFVRTFKAATLVPSYGDGSGTGTGGTIQIPHSAFEMWRGKWLPCVYKFPSVWKELATLRETLLRLRESPKAPSIVGTTVFYFTDNSGVYWICTSGSSTSRDLHQLLGEIRLLELELEIMLQVVHVPGLVLIQQGTDGLSRGVWMSQLHSLVDNARLTQAIFDPVYFDPSLVWEHLPWLTHRDQQWIYRDWKSKWEVTRCFNQITVWCPPPEVAEDLLTFLLNTWVERPHSMGAVLFIPRVLESSWRHLSRYIQEIGTIFPHKTSLRRPPLLPIPIVVLYIAPHICSLPTKSRLDAPSRTAPAWHKAEAAFMRGLPTGVPPK